jgi:hypothetical protein
VGSAEEGEGRGGGCASGGRGFNTEGEVNGPVGVNGLQATQFCVYVELNNWLTTKKYFFKKCCKCIKLVNIENKYKIMPKH